MFTNLKYPDTLIKSTICHFVTSVWSENPEVQSQSTNQNSVHWVVLPFKDQKSADAVTQQLSDLSKKIDHTLQPVFESRQICEDLKMCEPKPPIINNQCKLETMPCVQSWMWSVWCRVCQLHQPAFTPAYWWTPLFSNRQALKEWPGSGNHQQPYQQLFYFKESQQKTGLSDLWNVIHKEGHAWTHNQTPYVQNYLHKVLLRPKINSTFSLYFKTM